MVLLFDIDGTLLQGNGMGRRSVGRVLRAWCGRDVDLDAVSFSGKTDPQIFREIVTGGGFQDVDDVDAAVRDLLAAYAADVTATVHEAQIDALPGAHAAVGAAREAGVPVGLLTGNLEQMAVLKIERAGFAADAFPFGAYGSDHADRDCLAPIAAQRASAVLGRDVPHGDLVVVGDTPRDIACARAVGAHAVAVATGHFDADALGEADLVLESLAEWDLDAVRRLVR